MKIFHVTPSFAPQIGGIASVVSAMCAGLAGRGHDVGVIHFPADPGWPVEVDGLPVTRIGLRGHRLLGLAPGLRRALRGADVVHVHDPALMAVTMNVIAAARAPLVLSTHGLYGHTAAYSPFKGLHRRTLLPLLTRRYARVLASGALDFAALKGRVRGLELLENGVDLAPFLAIPRRERSRLRWLYWGRIGPNKRLEALVDLAMAVRSRGHDVRLKIFGRDLGGGLAPLKARIAAGAEGVVTLGDALAPDALAQEIAQAGLFASASDYEGFGLTFVEALAAGLPILTRDAAPMSGFAQEGRGLSLSFTDPASDAARFADWLNSPPPNDGVLRDYALTFDWAPKITRLVEIYEQMRLQA